MTTTKVSDKKSDKIRAIDPAIEEADMKARFLTADIYQALDKVPDDAIPDVKNHLEQALKTAKNAMETKKLETAKAETKKRIK